MVPVTFTTYEMQNQFGQVEGGRLDESLSNELVNLLGILYDVIHRCGCTHKQRNVHTVIVESLK